MTTHHFKLSYKEIEKNKGKPVIDPNEINYRDNMPLSFEWARRGEFFWASLKLVPADHYDKVLLGFRIFAKPVYDGLGINIHNAKYHYDSNGNYGTNKMGWDTQNGISLEMLKMQCTDDDGFVNIYVRITQFKMEANLEKSMVYIDQMINSNEPDLQSVADKLIDQRNNLEKAYIDQCYELQEVEVALESLLQSNLDIKNNNEKQQKTNDEIDQTIEDAKQLHLELEEELKKCSLNDALLKFRADEVRVDELSEEELKNLEKNLLTLILRIGQKLIRHKNQNENCFFCQRIFPSKRAKCDHVSICVTCLKQKPHCNQCNELLTYDNTNNIDVNSEPFDSPNKNINPQDTKNNSLESSDDDLIIDMDALMASPLRMSGEFIQNLVPQEVN